MSSLIPQEELQNFSWLLESWSWSFVGAMKGMGLEQPKWEAVGEAEVFGAPLSGLSSVSEEETEKAEEEQIFWWGQSFNFHTTTCVWFGASDAGRRQIGREALIAAGLEEPEEADILSTYHEIAATAMSALATRLTARCDHEVTVLGGEPLNSVQTTGVVRQVAIEMPSGEKLILRFMVSSEFIGFLAQSGFYRESGWIARDQRSGERLGPGARADASGVSERGNPSTERRDALPIDSVLDMDIPVSISFGTAKLRLDEALRLHEGSLVVLNRTIDELVELQVNGRVVARGQIMAARGQYGIKILELSSQGERMAHIDPEHHSGLSAELEASLN